ncbi:UNVERIFIED_CONTAM: hypothetical protein HDU68_006514, partial [Siphonaria sp. JEL0065]
MAGITMLPREILEQIVLLLPVNTDLFSLASVCKNLFERNLLQDLFFSFLHINRQLLLSDESNLWDFLDCNDLVGEVFRRLPTNYQTALYGLILTANPLVKSPYMTPELCEEEYWNWRMNRAPAHKLMTRLLAGVIPFDPAAQEHRSFLFACYLGHFEVVKLLLEVAGGVDKLPECL